MNYLQVTIPVADATLQEILIATLGNEDYEGFEEQAGYLLAFIPADKFDEERLTAILAAWDLDYTRNELAGRNWNEEWEKNFDPVVVEDFCAVRAGFHAPVSGVRYELVITPKMSFGTGHHATTYMMMAAMEHLDLNGKTVLDFGTGTGVLAILAEKLGAASVLAVDYDDWSIENSLENVGVNGCRITRVQKGDSIAASTGQVEEFDLILANINKNIILKELAAMGQHLGNKGVILLSGLLADDFEDIEKEAVKNNFFVSGRMTRGNWICLKVERKGK